MAVSVFGATYRNVGLARLIRKPIRRLAQRSVRADHDGADHSG